MEQPRVPAGSPEGGQFASTHGSHVPGVSGYQPSKHKFGYESEEDLHRVTKRFLGKSLGHDDLCRVAGVPPGSKITGFIVDEPSGDIQVNAQLLARGGGGTVGFQNRILHLKDKWIKNDSFMLDDDQKGKGIGVKSLVQQVSAAHAAGFNYILTKAAGGPGSDTNGYYTWPRLGFVPASSSGTVGAAGKSGINLTRLMSTEAGRKWWKAHGTANTLKFDLSEGSISRRVLTAYAKAKGIS